MDIQVVGHVCVDLTPGMRRSVDTTPGVLTEVDPLRVSIGGAVGNVARAVQHLGHSVSVAATVGQDELGSMCRAALEEVALPDRVFLRETSTSATSYSIVVQGPGEDRSLWHHTGANDEFDGTCELVDTAFLHFGYPTLAPGMTADDGQPTIDLFSRAHNRGSITSLDLAYCAQNSPLHDYDWDGYFSNVLPVTDVFCPSWDDITSALGLRPPHDRRTVEASAERFLEMGAGVVLISLGENGSYLRVNRASRLQQLVRTAGIDASGWESASMWFPAAPLSRLISTNAAGDTFKAAFLMAILNSLSPAETVRRAASTVARHIAGLPLIA